MFKRTGSILCPSCGKLVGVADERCLNCGRRNPGMWGLTSVFRKLGQDMGFVQAVAGGCGLLYIFSLVADPSAILGAPGGVSAIFSFLSPSGKSLLRFGASGAIPVFLLGRWWTLLSAGWLHAGLLHIGFNLYWVRSLAPDVAELYGASRMILIYTASSICGFLLSSVVGYFLPWLGGVFTVGASAPILGLLGALAYYGRRGGSRLVGKQAWSYAAYMLVFGLLVPHVDNMAHIGGFAGGYLTGKLLDPLKPERGDHATAAVICLVLTAASVAASLLVPIPLSR